MDAPDPCRVRWARLAELNARHITLLSPPEKARRARFARDADRDRFTLAAALLRLCAGAEVGVAPDRLSVDRTCPRCPAWHGRPRLPGHDLHVSVSHSGDVVAVAFTREGPVGVDVEQVTDLDYRPLCRHLLGPGEAPAITSREAFYRCWTRKESVVKATGDGLRLPLSQVLLGGGPARPTLVGYRRGAPPAATIADLAAPAGYAGAVTVLAPAPVPVREIPAGAPPP